VRYLRRERAQPGAHLVVADGPGRRGVEAQQRLDRAVGGLGDQIGAAPCGFQAYWIAVVDVVWSSLK
jgi:hypothetical protein